MVSIIHVSNGAITTNKHINRRYGKIDKVGENVLLYQGDCLEEMDKIQDKSIDMILCDLPYGTTACKWDTVIPFEPLWAQYKRVIKGNGAIVLTASQPFTSALVMSNLRQFKYELIWNKGNGKAPGVAKYRPMPSHESVLLFGSGTTTYNPQFTDGKPYKDVRKKPRLNGNGNEHGFGYQNVPETINDGYRYPLSVLNITSFNQRGNHPTQKPVALLEYLIRTYTNEGETVLDNCMGSGSTGVACTNTNRRFIGIELDENYYNISKKRIEEALHIVCE